MKDLPFRREQMRRTFRHSSICMDAIKDLDELTTGDLELVALLYKMAPLVEKYIDTVYREMIAVLEKNPEPASDLIKALKMLVEEEDDNGKEQEDVGEKIATKLKEWEANTRTKSGQD
jgi:ketosteroid isomerase-like protein